ncbi:hydrolase/acyltransferase [Paenibacillus alkalitolerans]|uniref:hydrolase/acyltransferase n=1 Tax=Paenibacillus alkalitolerans TaxID=2799335 RepID=UPI0018F72938|nr:hydrolase/acyltransferase [Paenibacillus alkalitolerans]
MRYIVLFDGKALDFVEMPASHAYQLTALHHRLHKEIGKLTAENVPALPQAVAECDALELVNKDYTLTGGLEYMNRLEGTFAGIKERSYPLVSLLTEIRALQAQLEQWYEEEMDE